MASRKAAVARVPSLLLLGTLLLVVMASPGAVAAEEDAASGQLPSPDRTTPTPDSEPSPKNSRAVRAGSPAVSSLGGGLPSAPATEGPAATPPKAPAPQPHARPKESDHKFCLFVLIVLILCCLFGEILEGAVGCPAGE